MKQLRNTEWRSGYPIKKIDFRCMGADGSCRLRGNAVAPGEYPIAGGVYSCFHKCSSDTSTLDQISYDDISESARSKQTTYPKRAGGAD